jgi:4-cresol dehydrogenase (hydroxylating)
MPETARISAARLRRALRACARVVGDAWVLAEDADRDAYTDPYALGDGHEHRPAAAVAPQSLEELQAIVRIANEFRLPLWPVSRGKNLGYGGAAPRLAGTVVLDLGRMKRILEIDEKSGHCLLEPGVGFIDLYNHLREHDIKLWLSVPGNGWGSVVGNALERGIGYTPYGDHTAKICGMEVLLPTGELIRTGMGAMRDSRGWQRYPYGFGPAWDQMFVQSNFGIVTKLGLWLMPEPECTLSVRVNLPEADDIGWAIDELAALRRRNVIEHNFVFGNYLHDAAVYAQRSEWYQGTGAIPDEVARRIIERYGIGWWSFRLALFGYAEAVEAHARVVRRALEPHLGHELKFDRWHSGEPLEKSAAPRPNVLALQIVNWFGGRGGHIGFSPVMPPDGRLALEQFHRMKARFEQFGLDYYTSFTMGQRHINNVNLILYNRDDAAMVANARALFRTLVADARAQGYGEYRTHLDFMQDVADSYDFNDHALGRLNARVKDLLDPNGILAPGKNGIWPRAYRKDQA